jgi:hypothetical protein
MSRSLKASNTRLPIVASLQRAVVFQLPAPAILALAMLLVAFGDKNNTLRKMS